MPQIPIPIMIIGLTIVLSLIMIINGVFLLCVTLLAVGICVAWRLSEIIVAISVILTIAFVKFCKLIANVL